MTHANDTELLIRRLRLGSRLDQDDLRAIAQLPMTLRPVSAGQVIAAEGDCPQHSCLVVSGFCYRAKIAGDGRRHILSIHIPGEIPDLQSLHLDVLDHDLRALSAATVGLVSHDALRQLIDSRPRVAAALWRDTLVDASIFREWIVVGRRPAATRIAHLVSELAQRLHAVGLLQDESFELPMTQVDLADALGMTPVHVNRVLQQLRKDGLLDLRRYVVRLADAPRLKALGEFDELYLHQGRAM
jgi:CRP-like cAMP-binding protein